MNWFSVTITTFLMCAFFGMLTNNNAFFIVGITLPAITLTMGIMSLKNSNNKVLRGVRSDASRDSRDKSLESNGK